MVITFRPAPSFYRGPIFLVAGARRAHLPDGVYFLGGMGGHSASVPKEKFLKKHWLQHWPLYVAVSALLLIVAVTVGVSVTQNQGHLVYALNDPYIGMAMARNFAQYGVWGVTRYAYTSCSSPPFWTLLLSLTDRLLGDRNVVPLLWDLVFSLLVLLAAYAVLSWYKVPAVAKLIVLLGIILLIPLSALIMTGMEPPLQILVSLLIVFVAARWISGEAPECSRKDSIRLLVLAPLVTGVRFEGLFLIIAITALLLMLRRWLYALAFSALGIPLCWCTDSYPCRRVGTSSQFGAVQGHRAGVQFARRNDALASVPDCRAYPHGAAHPGTTRRGRADVYGRGREGKRCA